MEIVVEQESWCAAKVLGANLSAPISRAVLLQCRLEAGQTMQLGPSVQPQRIDLLPPRVSRRSAGGSNAKAQRRVERGVAPQPHAQACTPYRNTPARCPVYP